MKLTSPQQAMLDGDRGWPSQIAMKMLTAVGKALDAPDLIPVSSAHLVIDGTALGEAGRDFLERLVDTGAKFAIPASLNAIAVNRHDTDPGPSSDEQIRMLQACEKMGALPSCSCNPFIQGIMPGLGDAVAWSESATAPFVNGVIGARTNREGATALASALTGLTPRYGMHLEVNRKGQLLFEIDARISGVHDFSLLGAIVGRNAGIRIPVLGGLDRRPSTDEFVAFCAAFAIFGDAAMFHLVGVTPEAPTVQEAFGDNPVPDPVTVTRKTLVAERGAVGPTSAGRIDVVSIGCPHASLDQLREVASFEETGVADGVRFFIHTNRTIRDRAQAEGTLARLDRMGVRVTMDNCAVVSYDRLPHGVRLATNSAKMALFSKSISRARVSFGSAEECIRAGLTGHWVETVS